MKKILAILGLILWLCSSAQARTRFVAYCEQPGITLTVGGLKVSQPSRITYPGCYMAVYYTATLIQPVIYADDANTVKANPFQADLTTGMGFFYADSGIYDVRMSGSTIPTPFTQSANTVSSMGYDLTIGSGLNLNVSNGLVWCVGSLVTYSGGTLTMTANSTNYVYLNTASSCVPNSGTSPFSATASPLGTVITGASTITSINSLIGIPLILAGGFVNPMTSLGDFLDGGASGTPVRIPGNTTATPMYLKSLGAGGVATAGQLAQIQYTDIAGTPTSNPMTTLGDFYVGGASGIPTRVVGNTTATPMYLKSLGSGGFATLGQLSQIQFSDIAGIPAMNTCNGTTIVCAETQAGNWGQKVQAANTIVAANGGGTIDARNLTGAQILSTQVVLSSNVSLYWGNARVQCTLAFTAFPCLVVGQYGSKIFTDTPGTGGPNPQGSVLWVNNSSTTTNPVLEFGSIGSNNPYQFGDFSGLAVYNVTSLSGWVANGYGIGVDFTVCQEAHIHEMTAQGFLHNWYSNLVSGCTCYNRLDNLYSLSYYTDGFYFGGDFNFNMVNNLVTNFPDQNSSIAVYVNGADGNMITGINCENGGATTTSTCLDLVGSGTFNNTVLGVVTSGSFGTVWADTSNALASQTAGNTIQANNTFVEIAGIPTAGASTWAYGSGMAFPVYLHKFSVGSGGTIGSTTMFTYPKSGHNQEYLLSLNMATAGGGASTATITVGWTDALSGSPNTTTLGLALSSGAQVATSTVSIAATGNSGITISSSGGTGAAWTAVATLTLVAGEF